MASGNPPILRIDGELQRVDYRCSKAIISKRCSTKSRPITKLKYLKKRRRGLRLRNSEHFTLSCQLFQPKERHFCGLSSDSSRVLSFEDFEKFDAPLPRVEKAGDAQSWPCRRHRPTGSGKSTTLAAMVDYCNKNRKDTSSRLKTD